MRILIHDYGGYPFCLELSREIAARGHEVRHAYFPAFCASMNNMAPRPDDPLTLEITPIGTDLAYTRYASMLRRRQQETAYGKRLSAFIQDWHPDVVICANTPLDALRQAFRATKAIGSRFVFWQQDIISIAMAVILKQRFGFLGSLIAGYYGQIEKHVALNSDAVVCIAQDFVPVLEKWGIPSNRCSVIENWAPKDDIRPLPKDNPWSRRHGLEDRKVFLYSGRLGLKHNPELLLHLARDYGRDRAIVLVVAEGPGAEWLEKKKNTESGLEGLRILPFQDYSELPLVLATGDVLIAIIEESAGLYSVPSKVLSYLAAGRAVLGAIPPDNTNARHIQRIGAGAVVPPHQPDAFLAAAHQLMDDEAHRTQAAQYARSHAERAFDISHIANRFMAILTESR